MNEPPRICLIAFKEFSKIFKMFRWKGPERDGKGVKPDEDVGLRILVDI